MRSDSAINCAYNSVFQGPGFRLSNSSSGQSAVFSLLGGWVRAGVHERGLSLKAVLAVCAVACFVLMIGGVFFCLPSVCMFMCNPPWLETYIYSYFSMYGMPLDEQGTCWQSFLDGRHVKFCVFSPVVFSPCLLSSGSLLFSSASLMYA